MAGGELLDLCVTVDRTLGFESRLSVPRGSTILDVKRQLAESDPTGSTAVEALGLGVSPTSPGQVVVPLPDATALTTAHLALDLCQPAAPAAAAAAEAPAPPDGAAARPVWLVVGGSDKGGIMVREGRDLKSPALSSRLGTGARVEELALEGERLRYRRLAGSGPETGWVSISLGGKDLAVREGSEGGESPAERWQSQIERICGCYAEVVAVARSIREEQQRGQEEGRGARLDELLRRQASQLAQCGLPRAGGGGAAAAAGAPERLLAKLQEASARLEEHAGGQALQEVLTRCATLAETAPDGSEMFTVDHLGVARGACERCRCCSWYRWTWDMSNPKNMRCHACDCPNTAHKSVSEETGEMPGYYPGIDDEETERLEDMRFRVEQIMTWN